MSETVAGSGQAGQGRLLPFLVEALGALRRRELLVPALLLLLILTFTNIAILANIPARGAVPSAPFLAAAVARLVGLLVLAVGILRILTHSSRPLWLPDGGFWLYLLTFAASAGVNVAVAGLLGDRQDPVNLVARTVLVTLLLSPFMVWVVAIAVARPLAWRPGPWLRDLRRWWAPLVFWSLLAVTPMAVLHASIDIRLLKGAGELFWPLALFDGALSTAMALLALSLNATAYRRVASR
jgi:hypothetical protein